MNRRSFVVGGAIGAVAAAFGVVRVATASPALAANAAGPGTPGGGTSPMAGMGMDVSLANATTYGFYYQGHSVRLTQNTDAAMLVIDGRHAIHLERPEIGQYHTHLLPFNSYTDSKPLVRDILGAARAHLFII